MTECTRVGCAGHIMRTGYCDTCGHRARSPHIRRAPEPPSPGVAEPARSGAELAGQAPVHAVAGVGDLDQYGLVVLPEIPVPSSYAIIDDPQPPTGGRPCGFNGCTMTIGIGYGGQPGRATGRCPRCGNRFSLLPQLRPGDVVADHYQILGCLAHGGQGWIYLAEDTRAKGHRVVLKGLINVHDALARRNAVEERRSLTNLHHPNIVRIITYADERVAGQPSTGYLVMDYIGGRSLRRLFDAEDVFQFFKGRPRLDHVLTYGCKILGVLRYLHERGLLYCDMKPDNVIHFGRDIKVIDLGAVRAMGDLTSFYVYTIAFAPPQEEIRARGWHIDSDLYTVGMTLQALARSAEWARGLAADSFRRIVDRATHVEPQARFHSAAEMSGQLWEALREFRSLRFGEQLPESSARFRHTGVSLDAGLGAIPSLSRWTSRPDARLRELGIAPPPADEVAGALPQPIPDAADGAALLLDTFPLDAPDRVAEQWRRESRLGTAETALWLCRAYLRNGEQGKADRWLTEAETRLGERAAKYDWRIAWHRGVLHLSRREVSHARNCFEAVYRALPGEYAPKLALGYCAEWHSEHQTEFPAAKFYEAVWKRDFAHAPAAFGLARSHLRAGERDKAVRVLDDVPSTSRHYDAARIAIVRIRTGTLRGLPPSAADLRDAAGRLPELRLDGGEAEGESRSRLVAEVRESILDCWPQQGWGPEFPGGVLFGSGSKDALRQLLEQSFRRLAGQARTVDEHGQLLDMANAVRPMTNF